MMPHDSEDGPGGRRDGEDDEDDDGGEPELILGVTDCREACGREWGGEFRVLVNQNIVLHLVRGFNDEMRRPDELPQFTIFASDERQGESAIVEYAGVKDLDPFRGAIFFVSRDLYEALVLELEDLARKHPGDTRIPSTRYGRTKLVRLLETRILEHPVVAEERRFDFTKRRY